ncbi:hypothetical protein [Subtercola boreus]|uniref:hypothetical protein n=1 Tax=Subtercola boreus TaxID=120213 RepID=UPI0011510708|nr:hypothetical protein [Subtercola boreus]
MKVGPPRALTRGCNNSARGHVGMGVATLCPGKLLHGRREPGHPDFATCSELRVMASRTS